MPVNATRKEERIDLRLSASAKALLHGAGQEGCAALRDSRADPGATRGTHGHAGERSGQSLPKDALLRTARAADIVGIRTLLVHAKDGRAQAFYARYDFEPSPTDPYHLYLVDLTRSREGEILVSVGGCPRFPGSVSSITGHRSSNACSAQVNSNQTNEAIAHESGTVRGYGVHRQLPRR